MKRDRFLVLPYSLHGKHIPSLMGRVVTDELDPLRRFAPLDYQSRGPDKLCPGILEEPIAYGSRADVIRNASSKELGLALTIYFALFGRRDKSDSFSLNADLVNRYQMTQNEPRLRRLMSDPTFESEVSSLLAENPRKRLYFVVGFLTTKGTKWELEGSQSRLATARARVPIGSATGAPPDLDVAGTLAMGDEHHSSTTGDVEQEEIFAVAYDIIEPLKTAKFWQRSTPKAPVPVLAGQLRAKSDYLALGEEGSDDEIEEDDSSGTAPKFAIVPEADETDDRAMEYITSSAS